MRRLILVTSLFAAAAFAAPVSAQTSDVFPIVDGTVEDGLGSPKDGVPDAVVEGSVVQVLYVERPSQPFEDRGIIEFDVSAFAGANATVELVLTTFASMGPFPFTVDVYVYAADGSLTLSDFNAGIRRSSFEYIGQPHATIDITDAVRDVIRFGSHFAGFNLRMRAPSAIEQNGPFVAFRSLEFPPAAFLRIEAGHHRRPHPHH